MADEKHQQEEKNEGENQKPNGAPEAPPVPAARKG